MEITKAKYYIIEIICRKKNKKALLKTLKDSICFIENNVGDIK